MIWELTSVPIAEEGGADLRLLGGVKFVERSTFQIRKRFWRNTRRENDMATCANCLHHSLCDYNTNISGNGKVRLVYAEGADVKCSFFKNTADVVPKSEVEELKAIIADHKANEEQWQELYADTVDKWEKAYEELEIKLENANTEVAREIFEEIEKSVASKIPMKIKPIFKNDLDFDAGVIDGKQDALFEVLVLIAELKKKYTEGKNENTK